MVKNYQITSTKAKHLQHHDFLPEKSPFKLIQEEFCTDPWKVLVVCMMLNMTRGSQVKTVVHKLFQTFHDPKALLAASDEQLIDIIKPLGLHSKRCQLLKRFSKDFLEMNWTYPQELYGIGKYADDCYRIFCCGEYSTVKPTDHALLKFITWQKDKTKRVDAIRDEVEIQVKDYKETKKLLRQKTKEREKKKAIAASQDNAKPEEKTQPSTPDSATSSTNNNNNNEDPDVVEIPKPVQSNNRISPFFLEKKKTTNKFVDLFKSRTRNITQPQHDTQPSPPDQPPSTPQPMIIEKLDVVYVSIAPIKEVPNPKKRTFGTLITNTLHTRSKIQTTSKRQAVEKITKEYENRQTSLSNFPNESSSPPVTVTI